MTKIKKLNRKLPLLLLAVFALPISSATFGQEAGITLNWKDADIRIVVEAVSEATGKNFILDPRVTGKVNLLSAEPMSKGAFYQAFLSILQVHGYIAVESGNLIKILPDATARQFPTQFGTDDADGPDDLATQVIQVKNVGATQLVPILRPLIPQNGHMVAHAGSNMLIISDRAANLARLVRIIRRIDMASDADIEIVPLQNASATDIVRLLTTLTQTARGDGAPVTTSLVADARTNSILIRPPAHQDADSASRYTVGRRWRHAGPIFTLRGCRRTGGEVAIAFLRSGIGCCRAGRRRSDGQGRCLGGHTNQCNCH